MLTLGDLHIGQDAIIRVVGGEGELRHHLLDMGLTPSAALCGQSWQCTKPCPQRISCAATVQQT